jgi:predicted Zn-dependent protease
MKSGVRLMITFCAVVCGAATLSGYALLGYRWPAGQIRMDLALGSSGTLSDGSSSWNQSFAAALAIWNANLPSTIRFTVVEDSTAPLGDGNDINNVFFSSTDYGDPFGASTLAITTAWTVGSTRTEADVVFNTAKRWDSYRGPLRGSLNDLRRVALHESGHALGLDHPDEFGQLVVAQMNSFEGDLDTLASDDVAGAQVLYSSALPPAPTPAPTVVAPGPPGGLTASASGSSVTLSWRAPSSGSAPTTYIIEAGSSPGAANLAAFSTGNTSTTFSTTGVGAGVYYVRVRAANSAGTSAASADALLTVGGGCGAAPSAPTSLRVVSNSGGTVVLSWTASSGTPTTYIVEAGSSPGLANLANSDLGGPSTSLTALNVGRGTYYVRVRAKNACGVGAVSNEIVLVVS